MAILPHIQNSDMDAFKFWENFIQTTLKSPPLQSNQSSSLILDAPIWSPGMISKNSEINFLSTTNPAINNPNSV